MRGIIGKLEKIRFYIINNLILKHHMVDVKGKLVINGKIKIVGKKGISINEGVIINSCLNANPIGGSTQTVLYVDGGKIAIGRNVGISNSIIVSKCSIEIEDDVMIGGNCKIYDTDFHSLEYETRVFGNDKANNAPIQIRKGAFIGANVIILKGVTIGSKSVVGSGSVVTKSIPDNEIWAGNPARYIRKVECI